ncbi:cell wall protein Ecm33 [Aspergillus melleus]|uniref:Cell wall protein Ecm33 n=1 Tax=Aspergillus melleus TaxID=138277 RepID=A0ACC3AVQ5_9EURO|nr:cell wall protein Ecm33 [Aspergillus melleus]
MKYINLILSLAGVSMAICGNQTLTNETKTTDCTTIFGDLKIGSNVTDYVRLEKLVSITGDLIGKDLNSVTLVSLPSLKSVGGKVDLSGAFYEVSLPTLDKVGGDFSIVTSEVLDCNNFKVAESGIGGQFSCQAVAPLIH